MGVEFNEKGSAGPREAELRVKIMQGFKVDPGELANAIATDDAEARLRALENYRDRRATLTTARDNIDKQLSTLTDELWDHDANRPELGDAEKAVSAAISDYYAAVQSWNQKFQRYRLNIEAARMERARLLDSLAALEGDESARHVGNLRGYRSTNLIEVDGSAIEMHTDPGERLKGLVDRLLSEAGRS